MHTYPVQPATVVPFVRSPMSVAHARLRLAGIEPRPYAYRCPPLAYHGIDVLCAWLVLRFIARPLAVLREAIREQIRRVSALSGLSVVTALRVDARLDACGDMILGLFSLPGLRWSIAFVGRGRIDQTISLLAVRLVRLQHDQLDVGAPVLTSRCGSWCLPPRQPGALAARLAS